MMVITFWRQSRNYIVVEVMFVVAGYMQEEGARGYCLVDF
jgi:hypothetical protein